ncbi:MAG: hypothetical protein AAFX93_11980 [Verrucomicrobiota bacterium]
MPLKLANAILLALLTVGCTEHLLVSSLGSMAYPSNDPMSPEYQHRKEMEERVRTASREFERNRVDPDAPIYVTP